MFAMLCGRLPFRYSVFLCFIHAFAYIFVLFLHRGPREGPKKRQKLLEQIAAGITDSHEAEMAHLSPGRASCHLVLLFASIFSFLVNRLC
jgi:F0F1-type ATP synthase membrane subunit a